MVEENIPGREGERERERETYIGPAAVMCVEVGHKENYKQQSRRNTQHSSRDAQKSIEEGAMTELITKCRDICTICEYGRRASRNPSQYQLQTDIMECCDFGDQPVTSRRYAITSRLQVSSSRSLRPQLLTRHAVKSRRHVGSVHNPYLATLSSQVVT